MCSSPSVDWYGVRIVDYGEMSREAFTARWTKAHEKAPYHNGTFEHWSKTRDDGHPYHYLAGVSIRAVTEDPGVDFMAPEGGEPDGDQA